MKKNQKEHRRRSDSELLESGLVARISPLHVLIGKHTAAH
jgi:hypothetical protein